MGVKEGRRHDGGLVTRDGKLAGKTDWDAYYSSPYTGSSVTRKISELLLLRAFRRSAVPRPVVVELGGANSCFYESVAKYLRPSEYIIVDSNAVGLGRFRTEHPEARSVRLVEADLLGEGLPLELEGSADVCFSVGLIEHFDPAETARVILHHFKLTKPGGLVVITFPTPTWLYRMSRFVSESLGMWIFHDERPLEFEEVLATVGVAGETLSTFVNWPILFTQGYLIALKK